jgi:hypothetical protein
MKVTGDKNWCKIMRLKDADVLVKKDYEPAQEEENQYKVDVQISVDDCNNQMRLGYADKEAQQRGFDKITIEVAQRMYEHLIQFHQ